MRKSSTSRRSFSNPVRVSTLEREDKSSGRSDVRRTQILKSKAQSQVDNSQIPRPRITSSSTDRSRMTSSSSDRSSIRRSNLKAPGKTPLGHQQLSAVRVSTATTPLHAQITPRVSTNRATLELSAGSRHRSPSAERASGFGAKGPKKDSRPLTDKTYQTSMLIKIDAYFAYIQQSSMLNQNGSLKPITLKIFVDVTSCLLNLLEVKHHLTIGNYMEEIPKIAKKLHYPAIITKSWLKTANTMHSWPQVLGWLSWLVEVCEAKDLAAGSFEIDNLPFIENDAEAETNRNTCLAILQFYGLWNEEKLEKEAAMIEEYVHKINNQHGDIDKAIHDAKQDLENEEASIQVANQQSAEINEQIGGLEDLLNTLKNDELQEIDRICLIESQSRRNILEIEQLNVDVNVLQEQIEKDTVQQAELNLIVEKQPMSIKERDDIVQECSEIQNYIRQFDSHVKDLEKELYAMDIKFSHTNQRLFNAILAYNNDIIMHLDCNTGADLEELKLPETNMLSPDFPDLLRIKERAMLNLKENARKQLNHNFSVIETSTNELEMLKDKLRALREENKGHVAKMKGQKLCIQQIQHRAKKNEAKLKEQMKSLQADIIQLQQSLPDLESVANELEEAQDKFEAVARRAEFFEKKAERFFNKFYQILANHRNDLAVVFKKLSQVQK